MDICYIYEITNKINGKTYIGQRKCPKGKTPWTDIEYMGSGKLVKLAEKKYGFENFNKEIIAVCYSRDEVNILEKEYIALYRSIGKAEYNIADGGNFSEKFNGGSRSEDGIKKWKKKAMILYEDEDYRRKHSEKIRNEKFYKSISSDDYKIKISNSSKKMWSDENKKKEISKKISEKTKGLRKSEEARLNISKAMRNSEAFKAAMSSLKHREILSISIGNSEKHWNAVHSEEFLAKCRERAKVENQTPAQLANREKFKTCCLGRKRYTTPDGRHILVKPENAKMEYVRGWI